MAASARSTTRTRTTRRPAQEPGLGTQAADARVHNSKRRKHSLRKRFKSGGLYRPHLPARAVELPEEEKKKLVPTKKNSTTAMTLFDEIRSLEKVLEDDFEQVLEDTVCDGCVPGPSRGRLRVGSGFFWATSSEAQDEKGAVSRESSDYPSSSSPP